MTSISKKKKGQVSILVAILLIALLGFLGLTVDVWHVAYEKQSMQNSLDLAVLAGARELVNNPGNAVSVTKNIGEKNGLDKSKINVTTSYQGDKNKIQAQMSKDVQFWFMPVLGIKNKTVSVSAAAIAKTSATARNPAFDYVFFSASTSLGMKSSFSNTTFNGKARGNYSFETSGGKDVFNDDLEVVGKLSLKTDTIFNGRVINPAPVVPIPEYDINEFKSKATKTYNSSVTFSGGILNLNGITFVDGDITINGGCTVQGKGSIIATGNITITGGSKLIYSSDDSIMGFYSLKNITVTGGNYVFSGIFYAPKGEIVITGGTTTFYGAVIGNTIRISAGNYIFNHDPRAGQCFEEAKYEFHLIE